MMTSFDAQIQFGGERRQVTALFYDIVGSTQMLLSSDPEEFFRSVAGLHDMAEAVIQRHGGFLSQRLGDGGCCYFGYPEQSEDAAERAVEASLELIAVTGRRRRAARKAPFQLRVGVATGLVVLSADGKEILGTAPVLAARLQAEAQPDSVVVADSTYQLTRGRFEFGFLRKTSLKGFAEPVPAWQPLGKSQTPGRFSPGAGRVSAMRGRDAEMALMMEAWRAVCAGQGRSVAIVGDAGIGKSRLIAEFRRALKRAEGSDLFLQCSNSLTNQPLHPLIGFLEHRVGRDRLRSGSGLHETLAAVGLHVDPGAAAIIGEFAAERLKAASGNIRVTDISGRLFRGEVIDAAVEVLHGAARDAANIIVFEDTHWADSMTLELLDALNADARHLPLMVIQTSRKPVSQGVTDELVLSRLAPEAIGDLVGAVWGGAPPPGLAGLILEQSDGLPLYAEELALFFRTRQGASQTPDSQTPAGWTKLLIDEGVSSLNDLLAAKLAEAGTARRTAQLASVIGREFSATLLRQLVDTADAPSPEGDLATLVAHGVMERGAGPDAYQFRHVLQHEAAYGNLLRSDRRRIHSRIAHLLLGEEALSLPAAVASWHCAEAGMHAEAARFALEAAEACVQRSAMREAARTLELCAEEIAAMPRQADRSGLQLDLLQLQGVVSTALHGEGSQQVRQIYSRAMALVRRGPAANRQERFPLYWGWWFTAPDISAQQSRAQILVEDMSVVEDPETRLQSYHCGWATSFHAGQHGFCLDCVRKGLAHYDADRAVRNRPLFGGHDAKVCGLGESALSNLLIGRAEASEAAIGQCLEWADRTEHAGSRVHALYYAMELRRCQGRHEHVRDLAGRMLSLADDNDITVSRARAHLYAGWAEAMSSSLPRGIERFEAGLALQHEVGTGENLPIYGDMHAAILERQGRLDEAIGIIENALKQSRKTGQSFWLAELYRRRAGLRLARGEKPATAQRDLARALQTARLQGADWLAKRASRDLRHHFG